MATTTTERFESYIVPYGPNVEIGFDPEYGIVYGPGSVGILSEHLQAAGLPTRRLADGHLVAVAPKGRAVHVLCSGVIMISTEDGPATGRCGYWVDREGTWGCPGHEAEATGWLALSEAEKADWERRYDREHL